MGKLVKRHSIDVPRIKSLRDSYKFNWSYDSRTLGNRVMEILRILRIYRESYYENRKFLFFFSGIDNV